MGKKELEFYEPKPQKIATLKKIFFLRNRKRMAKPIPFYACKIVSHMTTVTNVTIMAIETL